MTVLIETRQWAHREDELISTPAGHAKGTEPHGKSPDAIGGAYGIAWWEYFRESTSRRIYRVRCTDGVNGGRGPYRPEPEETVAVKETGVRGYLPSHDPEIEEAVDDLLDSWFN
jgi:hypothetical protein